jgi:hypothetical protein
MIDCTLDRKEGDPIRRFNGAVGTPVDTVYVALSDKTSFTDAGGV